ncbi:RNA polymerase-associated protein RapA [Gammaproteobacteria bacterium]|nr:RNA polymerase-associated protein RapA [Gammaproteobacteria bacterium]
MPGQRWISDSEPELGLGLIVEVEHRILTVEFPQSGETRHYAKDTAPITRISFIIGDEVHDRDQQAYTVVKIDDVDGLLVYQVKPTEQTASGELMPLLETALSDAISLNQPLNRLISGQADHSHWFQLRAATLQALHFIEKSSLLGLCSARTELIPHQLYIANEVAQRFAPRVLLADEVGLGKTIEACLILQQQLFSGLSSRILIIVPESLIHQWLVELLRRFNLAFSIFDKERCLAIAEDSGENPFFTEQFVLCSSSLFIHSPELHNLALAAEWDLLIVDEAHHLKPADEHTQKKKAENIAYDNIEKFSSKVKGLILLTATPDQLGQKSHFALLRLLDPNRFHNFTEFVREQDDFIQIAGLIEKLEALDLQSEHKEAATIAQELASLFTDKDISTLLSQLQNKTETHATQELNRKNLITAILDRHGTGRILFRNTRKVIAGFPPRRLHAYPLALPELYADSASMLEPEQSFRANSQWLKTDPRIHLVESLLEKYHQQKILLICASKETVLALDEFLRLNKGIKTSVFHEAMSIVERDRSAAYFADKESGGQILLCSEIGSEGRNFQFSHHLVLFDLPLNPDLLEQRIGRLDRIGQTQTINVHVPYLKDSAQETLFTWYHKGLNAFEKTNPAAYKVFEQLGPELEQALVGAKLDTDPKTLALIEHTQTMNHNFLSELAKGRDRLLEMNSFNANKSQDLIAQIKNLEQSSSPEKFLASVFDNFGIDTEQNSNNTWTINLSDQMVVESFPAIPDQGLTLTYQREIALHREDVQFVNWHHPLIEQSIDLILQGDLGKSAIAILQDKRLKTGTVLLESLYRVNIQASKELQAKRFLPSTTIRVLIDSERRKLSNAISAAELDEKLQHVDKSHLMSLITESKGTITEISLLCEQAATEHLPALIKSSSERMLSSLSAEIKRLVALKQVNSNIREAEIEFLKNQVLSLHQAFANASLQLEGVRLIFVA